jgi:hypothetical protein
MIKIKSATAINARMDSEYSYGLPDANLLEELVKGLPVFEFTSLDDLERLVRDFQNKSEYEHVLFTRVPYPEFTKLCSNESSPISHCKLLYIHSTQALRLRIINSPPHELAARGFDELFYAKYTALGLTLEIDALGEVIAHMGTTSKKADACWGSCDKNYITAALEVGMSESLGKLTGDARLWLETPASHVTQVFLIKIQPKKPEILFQVWALTIRESWKTRTVCPKEGKQIQQARVTLENDSQIEVDGNFQISISKILERPEGDVVFTRDDLIVIATRVWRKQGFLAPHGAAGQ